MARKIAAVFATVCLGAGILLSSGPANAADSSSTVDLYDAPGAHRPPCITARTLTLCPYYYESVGVSEMSRQLDAQVAAKILAQAQVRDHGGNENGSSSNWCDPGGVAPNNTWTCHSAYRYLIWK